MWANALGESAVVLARHFPSPVADNALSLLVRADADAGNVHMTSLRLTGFGLMFGGAVIRLWCYRTLGKFFTWELTVRKDHKLVTTGPYAVVRHPAYVGSTMLGVGVIMYSFSSGSWYAECVGWTSAWSWVVTAAWAGWLMFLPTWLISRVNKEDDVLRKEFGEVWEEYREQTPWRLVPYIY